MTDDVIPPPTPADEPWDIIFQYTRQQAIDDGVLVDVSATAREAGFKYPVAVTSRLWHEWIVPDQASRAGGQDENGRLWDVLWMLLLAIKRSESGSELRYQVLFLVDGRRHEEVTIKSVCGPGDDLSSCITIMLPDED